MTLISDKQTTETKPVVKTDLPDAPPIPESFQIANMDGETVLWINVRVKNTDAATAANYGPFFIAPFDCEFLRAFERHGTKGSQNDVTLDIEKLSDGTAKGSGVSVLASVFGIGANNSSSDVFSSKDGTLTAANRRLARGEVLALKTAGTLTDLNDVVVTVLLRTNIKNLIPY